MLKKFSRLKGFTAFFLTHLKSVQFVKALIVLGKWKVFAGLQIHPKTILTRINKVGVSKAGKPRKSERQESIQGAKACKARRHEGMQGT